MGLRAPLGGAIFGIALRPLSFRLRHRIAQRLCEGGADISNLLESLKAQPLGLADKLLNVPHPLDGDRKFSRSVDVRNFFGSLELFRRSASQRWYRAIDIVW